MVNQPTNRLALSSTLSSQTSNASRSPFVMRLQPTLSSLETWGFGFSGLLLWLGPAPAMHAALGPQAIFVWIPGVIVGMLLNLQVKHLGSHWTQVVGGTPNYTTRLLEPYPTLAAYSAIGYFFGWAAVPLVNAIILSDLIKTNLASVGMSCPEVPLKIGFTLLAFVVALSGTRALGILHLFFVVPALGLLIAFCLQGIGWLTLASTSPGFFPTDWHSFSFVEWAKWFFIIVYAVYACETASSFVADSRRPIATLRCLSVTTWLIPLIYLGGSWVLMRLSIDVTTEGSAFLSLLSAATPFWGPLASLLVTFLIASSCLISCATGFSNAPRVLYQLALDGYIAPVFAVVSRRGVLAPALIFTLLLSLTCVIWGDVSRVVMVTGTGYFCSIIATHLGLWLQRDSPTVKWAWGALAFFVVECVVLVVGGLAWNWQDFVIGLLLPVTILGVDALIRQLPVPAFQPQWWSDRFELPARRHQQIREQAKSQDFVAFQVGILLLLVCSTAVIVWLLASKLGNAATPVGANLFVVLLLTIAFISIAVACWTSLPQVISIAKAREHAEHLFTSTLDALLVLDENRVILQANSAAETLFGVEKSQLVEQPLKELLTELPDDPREWLSRSEQILARSGQELCIVEIAISKSSHQDSDEYVVILRNITQRKQTEKALRESEAQLRQQTQQLEQTLRHLQKTQAQLVQTEKMSALGQLVAGVAHEINNPVNFIYGNVVHASRYSSDLLELMQIYEDVYPDSVVAIQEKADEIDLAFLKADLPKLLNSMEMGTERIREIVRSLRTFSRLDEAEVKEVDIHEGIDSTLMILQSRLKETPHRPAIRVVKEYADLPLVECYAGQLNQVFMNVLVNAIDALEEFIQSAPTKGEIRQGIITICTAVIDAQRVTIQIADNGLGMTEEVQRRLLDPFFTTKPAGKGTGLGMVISQQIVTEKHGGLLQCMSAPGKGTMFTITIPLKQH